MDEQVVWATPGVTGLERVGSVVPGVSAAVVALQAAVERALDVDPTRLPAAQALVDAEALLGIEQQLRLHDVARVADVAARGLHELVGFRSARTWLRDRRPDGDSADAQLGLSLRPYPVLSAALSGRGVSLQAAKKVVHALKKCAPHVDRADGLIDCQPGVEVITAVVGHVTELVCQHWMGVADQDPRLLALQGQVREILAAGGSDLLVLERAFVLLARHIGLTSLTAALDLLVMAVLPSKLQDRALDGLEQAGLVLRPKDDGSGWRLSADLSLECGERAFTALRGEANRDEQNAADTAAWRTVRELQQDGPVFPVDGSGGLDGLDGLGAAVPRPRSQRRRLHDALNNVLGDYLAAGLGGTQGKVPVQVNVTLPEAAVTGAPGALPAVGGSGQLLPTAMVRRWWCDATVTAYVVSMGGKALRTVHTQRTITGRERTGRGIETGQTCAGVGCCTGRPDPLRPLVPHHPVAYAICGTSSIEDTVLICEVLHHDIHEAQRTVLLRDGRYLNEAGYTNTPALFDHPPF
jgi:hypothetical protein